MISILDDLSNVTNSRAEYIVYGDNIEELLAASTSNTVLQKAATDGLHRPGVSNAGGPYPVDAEGKTDDSLLLGKRGPVAGYRRDFIVLASI
jgi:hypothetical protein